MNKQAKTLSIIIILSALIVALFFFAKNRVVSALVQGIEEKTDVKINYNRSSIMLKGFSTVQVKMIDCSISADGKLKNKTYFDKLQAEFSSDVILNPKVEAFQLVTFSNIRNISTDHDKIYDVLADTLTIKNTQKDQIWIRASIPHFSISKNDSVQFLHNHIALQSVLSYNKIEQGIEFSSAETMFNELPIQLNGQLFNDDAYIKINFDQSKSEQFLSILPGQYQKEIINSTGTVQGDIIISKGSFQADVVPTNFGFTSTSNHTISDIAGQLAYRSGNNTSLTLQDIHLFIDEQQVTINGNLLQANDSIAVDIQTKGILNLDYLNFMLKNENRLKGNVDFDLNINKTLTQNTPTSTILESMRGKIALNDVIYWNNKSKKNISIESASLIFTEQQTKIQESSFKISGNQFYANGNLMNFMGWIDGKKDLTGVVNLNSDHVNTNMFDKEEAIFQPVNNITPNEPPFKLPSNVNLHLNTNFKTLHIDDVDFNNVSANIITQKHAITIEQFTAQVFNGLLKSSGHLVADGLTNPSLKLLVNTTGLDVQTAHNQLKFLSDFAPFLASIDGKANISFDGKCQLTQQFTLLNKTLLGKGTLTIPSAQLNDDQILEPITEFIDLQKLKNRDIKNFNAQINIKNEEITVEPFEFMFADQSLGLGGIYRLNNTMDMEVKASVQRRVISENVEEILSFIPGSKSIKKIDLAATVRGNTEHPQVVLDTNMIKQQVFDALQKSDPGDLENAVKGLLNKWFK